MINRDLNRDYTDAGFGPDATTTHKGATPAARAMESDRSMNNLLAHIIDDMASDQTDLVSAYKARGLPQKIVSEMERGAAWAVARGASRAAVRSILDKALPTIEDVVAPFAFGHDKGTTTKSLNPWERVNYTLYWKEVPDGLGGSKFIFDMAQLLRDLQAAGRLSVRESLGL